MASTRSKFPVGITVAMLALLVPSCAVMAQHIEPDPNDPCASRLDQQSPKGEEDGKAAGTDQENEDSTETGERLARCGDVLTPPKTGDTELVKPAPETGTTPVIRPKVLPKQQESDPDAQ